MSETTKLNLEQSQRERRRAMELNGDSWTPRWFIPRLSSPSFIIHDNLDNSLDISSSNIASQQDWMYKGGYWEARQENFKDVPLPSLW